MRESENPKIVILFDNSFLDFLSNEKVDLKVLDYAKQLITSYDLMIMSEEVYITAQQRGYPFPYGQLREDLYKNWVVLRGAIYKDIDQFQEDHENVSIFVRRAFNCFQTHVDSEEMDALTSALLLKSKDFNPVIISDDKRFLFYADIISSYFGFCLKLFSTFELLTYLSRFAFRGDLLAYNGYFKIGMNLDSLDDTDKIRNCEDFFKDIVLAMGKGILSAHPSIKSKKMFRSISS